MREAETEKANWKNKCHHSNAFFPFLLRQTQFALSIFSARYRHTSSSLLSPLFQLFWYAEARFAAGSFEFAKEQGRNAIGWRLAKLVEEAPNGIAHPDGT